MKRLLKSNEKHRVSKAKSRLKERIKAAKEAIVRYREEGRSEEIIKKTTEIESMTKVLNDLEKQYKKGQYGEI